ncbi:MAG: acyltransferase [Planctomycetaceae bacterium]|nr:acyltransferase [Planctomycetaceae bacterium]
MINLHKFLATSDHPFARMGRNVRRWMRNLSLPAPRIVVKPMLWCFLAIRNTYYFVMRVFICEPLFKAYCTKYGNNLHTGVFIHWVMGKGNIIIGDNVTIDGKCSFIFSSRYCDMPKLEIGHRTGVGANCSFVVGKHIHIGEDCMIAGGTSFFDSNGHPADPDARKAKRPPSAEEVRPIEIGDNVWIGNNSTIFPGVRIGEGSIVSARSVVRTQVRPYTVVAGNPARKICDLSRPVVRNEACCEAESRDV